MSISATGAGEAAAAGSGNTRGRCWRCDKLSRHAIAGRTPWAPPRAAVRHGTRDPSRWSSSRPTFNRLCAVEGTEQLQARSGSGWPTGPHYAQLVANAKDLCHCELLRGVGTGLRLLVIGDEFNQNVIRDRYQIADSNSRTFLNCRVNLPGNRVVSRFKKHCREVCGKTV